MLILQSVKGNRERFFQADLCQVEKSHLPVLSL